MFPPFLPCHFQKQTSLKGVREALSTEYLHLAKKRCLPRERGINPNSGMTIPLSSKIPLMQVLKQWALQDLGVYLAKVIPFFAEKAGRSQLGSGVSLAEGSLVMHCVIPAFTGKRSKGYQIALSQKLLDPLASCFFFLLPPGSPGNTGKHKACFISVDVLFSRFVLGQTSYPITSTQVLHMDC